MSEMPGGSGLRGRNGFTDPLGRIDVRHLANTIEDMKKLLVGYRDNMRVEIEGGIAVTAKTVADLRAVHTDFDPR